MSSLLFVAGVAEPGQPFFSLHKAAITDRGYKIMRHFPARGWWVRKSINRKTQIIRTTPSF
jgi:hypothetical protein